MKTAQAKIQKFGSLLSAMVMPNIGVFIGWGLLTALFIDTGWTPNAYLNKLVSPILTYLLPCLIGYTAGSNIYGRRGGVIGAFATMGAVVGADVTMLVAGMILGPVAAICIRAFDKAVEGKVKPGLEMLVDNFSLGIIGFVICIIGYVGVAPIMTAIQTVLTGGVQYLTNHNMLPLTELFVQPAEILFLNNAINHGIMTPLGLQQAAETGKSVLFLVEASGDHHVLWWYRRSMFSILPDNAINDHWTNPWKYVFFICTYKLWRRCRWTSISRISYFLLYDDTKSMHVSKYDRILWVSGNLICRSSNRIKSI